MRMRTGQVTLYLFCCLSGLSGCALLVAGTAGATLGVGTYHYVEGNLERDYMGPFPKVWQATVEGLDELKVPYTIESQDAFGGQIKGTLFDGTKATIDLKKKSDTLTTLSVRVGLLGDRDKSQEIQETITSRFKKQ